MIKSTFYKVKSLSTDRRDRRQFWRSVGNNLDKIESDTISDSVDMNNQTESMVDPVANSLAKRMSEDEHASERRSDGREHSILRTKIDGKS